MKPLQGGHYSCIICEQVKQSHMPSKDWSGHNRLGVTTSCCTIGPYDLILGVKVFCFGFDVCIVNTKMKIAGAPQSLAEIGCVAGETCTVMSAPPPPPPPPRECVHMYMNLEACVTHCRTSHLSLEV